MEHQVSNRLMVVDILLADIPLLDIMLEATNKVHQVIKADSNNSPVISSLDSNNQAIKVHLAALAGIQLVHHSNNHPEVQAVFKAHLNRERIRDPLGSNSHRKEAEPLVLIQQVSTYNKLNISQSFLRYNR